MNNRRAIFWMLLTILMLVAAHILLNVRGTRANARILRQSVLVRGADQATGFLLARQGEAEVAVERKLGDGWRIVAPFEAAADARRVMQLADALAFRTVLDSQSDFELLKLGRTRADFGLDAPRLSVSVLGEGVTNAVVSFGSLTPTEDGVYVAVADSDLVYVASTNVLACADLPTSGFRERRLFLSESEVETIDVRRGSDSFLRLVRKGEVWRMEEPRKAVASAQRVALLLSALRTTKAEDFFWPVGATNESPRTTAALLAGYGLDPESAVTITLRGRDGTDCSISLGKEAGHGRVYALVQNGEAVVSLDAGLKDLARTETEAFVDSRLFPYEAKAITTISMVDGATTYLLARTPNGRWRMDAPVVAHADQTAVEDLLARLLRLEKADAEGDGVKVSVATNAEPVAVSRARLFANHRLEDLRSKNVLRVAVDDVGRIVSTATGEKPTSVVWNPDSRVWNVESSPRAGAADEKAIAALLVALNPLRAVSVAKLKVSPAELGTYGLETPRLTVAVDLRQEGVVRRNILIGDRAEGGYYATLGSLDAVFILPAEAVERLSASLVNAAETPPLP